MQLQWPSGHWCRFLRSLIHLKLPSTILQWCEYWTWKLKTGFELILSKWILVGSMYQCRLAFSRLNFNVLFQAVQLETRERLLAFCEAVQRCCPVGSFIKPIAGPSPGYASEVRCLKLYIQFCFWIWCIYAHYDIVGTKLLWWWWCWWCTLWHLTYAKKLLAPSSKNSIRHCYLVPHSACLKGRLLYWGLANRGGGSSRVRVWLHCYDHKFCFHFS